MHLDYQSDALVRDAARRRINEVEVIRWHGDIGAIEMRIGNGEWMTVPAADEQWIGKTDVDLREWLGRTRSDDLASGDARFAALNDMNEESYRLKKLCGLISMPRTEEDFDRQQASFARHMDTAERRHQFGEYDDILDGVVDPAAASTPENSSRNLRDEPENPDDDLME